MTDNQKPAPCPWCGGCAIVASASVAVNDRQWVNCLNKSCGAHGPMNWGNPKGAIAAWNRIAQRPAPAADADLEALEAAARAATPGPWDREGTVVWSPTTKQVVAGASNLHPDHDFVKYCPPNFRDIDGPASNAAHIAAANPAAVLALIQRVREAERRACKVRWEAHEIRHDDYEAFVGPFSAGKIFALRDVWVFLSGVSHEVTHHPTEAAARAALETAVMEAIGND